MNLCTIYVLKNKINNKVYIGQTWKLLIERWNNGKGYLGCRHMNYAINKYGKNNFYYQILTFCSTQKTANYWEEYFINKYDSVINGYNLKKGGSTGKHSEESKRLTSQSLLGRKFSDEHKKKIANGRVGKKHTEETKKIISKLKIGTKMPQSHKNKMSIRMIGNSYRKGIGSTFKGKKHTEEAKEKNRLAHTGNKNPNPNFGKSRSEETKKKISEALKGKSLTEETKKKLSEATKGLRIGNKNPNFGKYKFTSEQILEMKKMRDEGKSYLAISKIFGCADNTVKRLVSK